MEALKAKEHLTNLESKIKHRNQAYQNKVLETVHKASSSVNASKEGYEKYSQMRDKLLEQKTLHVLQKNDKCQKKQRKVQ